MLVASGSLYIYRIINCAGTTIGRMDSPEHGQLTTPVSATPMMSVLSADHCCVCTIDSVVFMLGYRYTWYTIIL
jgi:hypothetical protein